MNRFILLCIFSVFLPAVVLTQTYAEKELATQQSKAAIKAVKEGVLVFRLQSDYKKLNALRDILAQPDLPSRKEVTVKDRIRTIILERDAKNKMWIELMKFHFTFSEVLFTYDTTSANSLNELDGMNCFLNEDLEIDSAVKLDKRPYIMAYFGHTSNATGTGLDAVLFKNADFEKLTKPFPYYIKRTRFTYYKNAVFNPAMADRRNIEKVSEKINEELTDYYEDVF
jgi:hypothetical protein